MRGFCFPRVACYRGLLEASGHNQDTYGGLLGAIDGRLEWREWETADEQRRQAVSVARDSLFPPLIVSLGTKFAIPFRTAGVSDLS
jgi:single-stranded DNA-binding protein